VLFVVVCGNVTGLDDDDTFLVPIDSDITVSPRPDDYEMLTDEQFPLQNLPANDYSLKKNAYRILSWEEVYQHTIVLRKSTHHSRTRRHD